MVTRSEIEELRQKLRELEIQLSTYNEVQTAQGTQPTVENPVTGGTEQLSEITQSDVNDAEQDADAVRADVETLVNNIDWTTLG